jgi:hypothetical protein
MDIPANPANKRHPKLYLFAFAAFIVLIIIACWAYTRFISDAPAIYTAGCFTSGRGFRKPCYFRYYRKDLNRYELSMPLFSNYGEAVSITVAEGTVYTAGFFMIENDIRTKACYWQEAECVELPIPQDAHAKTTAITVSDGTVYTAGYYFTDDIGFSACYWKGTERIELPLPADVLNAETTAITVSEGVVYVSGSYNEGITLFKACYWQGTRLMGLSHYGNTDIDITGIAVTDETVHLVANCYDNAYETVIACYRQGGEWTELPAPAGIHARTSSITLAGGTAYTSGYCYDETKEEFTACYWRGTGRIDLPVPFGYNMSGAFAIAPAGRTVYTAGIYTDSSYYDGEYTTICYWKNGKFRDIGRLDGFTNKGFYIHVE